MADVPSGRVAIPPQLALHPSAIRSEGELKMTAKKASPQLMPLSESQATKLSVLAGIDASNFNGISAAEIASEFRCANGSAIVSSANRWTVSTV
jgi:hypothetical protein